MSAKKELFKGILSENPSLVLLLGLCPTLAVTSSVKNAIGMGLAATVVLILSNPAISLIRSLIPSKIRIPCFIVVIATFVSVVQLLMKAYFPAINDALGIFLPLIVVNCIILGRAEAFASKNTPGLSILDGLGMGLGFTLALTVISSFREFLGTGKLLEIPVTSLFTPASETIKPATIFIMAPGAFLVFAVVLAILAKRKAKTATLICGADVLAGYSRGSRFPAEIAKALKAKEAAAEKSEPEAAPASE